MLLPIHVAAGGLAMLLGVAALLAAKGGTMHRRSGLLFVAAMLALGVSGSLLALLGEPVNTANVLGGLMAVYFASTALTTVRPVSAWTRGVDYAALAVAAVLVAMDVAGGVKALGRASGVYEGVPYFMHFLFAGVILLAAVGDVRVLCGGVAKGSARLVRHLWRMCFALFIAAGSFFSIEARVAKVLPAAFTSAPMRAAPVLLVFVAMFYWWWKVRRRERGGSPAAAFRSAGSY